MVVDAARNDERQEIVELTLAAYREYESEGGPGFWERYSRNIRDSITPMPDGAILVVRDGGRVVGSAVLCPPGAGPVPNDWPEMRLLAVHPDYRGRGVGALLIGDCERRAAPHGVITLHTTRLMKTAKAMYERRGYQRFPDIDFEPAPGFAVWGFKKVL